MLSLRAKGGEFKRDALDSVSNPRVLGAVVMLLITDYGCNDGVFWRPYGYFSLAIFPNQAGYTLGLAQRRAGVRVPHMSWQSLAVSRGHSDHLRARKVEST